MNYERVVMGWKTMENFEHAKQEMMNRKPTKLDLANSFPQTKTTHAIFDRIKSIFPARESC